MLNKNLKSSIESVYDIPQGTMSFFGSKSNGDEEKGKYPLVKTGGEIDDIVGRLLHHAADKEEQVRLSIRRSLQKIGEEQPELVLTMIMRFVTKRAKEKKLSQEHRVVCLHIMNSVLEVSRDKMSDEVAQAVGRFGASELTNQREVSSDWQGAASTTLVLLAGPHPNFTVDELLARWSPGQIPHYFVVKTLADVASANGVYFTLRLREVLSRVIPVLGSVQAPPMQWVFAAALGRFAESVLHFQSNASDDQKLQVPEDAFQNDMSSAFDVILTNWLGSKESKVRYAVSESLGYMSRLVSESTFETNLTRLVPRLLMMTKKEKFDNILPITKGLNAILEAGVAIKCNSLELVLNEILSGMHPFLAIKPDFRNPQTLKIHNEILRMFEIIARDRIDTVLTFLVNQFPIKNEKATLGSLLVMRHLVNALDAELSDKKPFILSSVQALVTEPSLYIRKAMLQLVVGMANQDYLSIAGGEVLVKYVAKQCAISDSDIAKLDGKNKDPDVSASQIRHAANHILTVMANKVPSTHPVVWPFVLELISAKGYEAATVVVSQSIADVINFKKEQGEQVTLNFSLNPNLPTPQTIMARLLILANVPFRSAKLGSAVLSAMEALAPMLHPALGEYWAEAVPALQDHLQEHTKEDLNDSKWQDTLLKVFRESVAAIGPGPWLRDLANDLTDQYDMYAESDHTLRRVIHRYTGALLASLSAREVISAKLDLVLSKVNHKSNEERIGCAQGMGLASTMHIDVVLPKLTAKLTAVSAKKKSGFFSFGRSSSSSDNTPVKCTLVLCYGYCVAYSDTSLMSSRLEPHVLNNVMPIMKTASSEDLKECVIKAIDLIGKAMHPERLSPDSKFLMKQRDQLIAGILRYLGMAAPSEGDSKRKSSSGSSVKHKPTNHIRVLGLNAIATLINLPPALAESSRQKVLDVILPSFEMDEIKDDEVAELVMVNMNSLLSAMIHMDTTLPTLAALLQRLEFYVVSKKALERQRACESYLVILKKFVSMIVSEGVRVSSQEFDHIGHYIGTMLPRCSDSDEEIRIAAVENVQALLYIDQLLRNSHDPKPSQEVKLLTEIRGSLEDGEHEDHIEPLRDMSGLLCTLISPTEYPKLLDTLLSGLGDSDTDAGLGAAVCSQTLIDKRGSELLPFLPLLVKGFVKALGLVSSTTSQGTLAAFRTVTKTHFQDTLESLLQEQLPVSPQVISIFKALASGDLDLTRKTVDKLVNVINDSPILEEKQTPKVMVATVALSNILTVEADHILPYLRSKDTYCMLLGTLLMRVGTAQGVDDGTSSEDAVKALRAFVERAHDESTHDVAGAISEELWTKLEGKDFDDGIAEFTDAFCEVVSERSVKVGLIKFLSGFLSQRAYFGQRIAATSVLGQFVNHSKEDAEVLAELVKLLLPRAADSKDLVRKQALRGLGNFQSVWDDDLNSQGASMLSALTSASEDQTAYVAAEAVASLTRVAEVVTEDVMHPMLINICYRLKPAFDRKEARIRAAAFTLFGALCKFGINHSSFMDQIHENLVTFVVHMNDEDEEVRLACHEAFKALASLAGTKIADCIAEASCEPYAYDAFAEEIAPLLVEAFPDRLGNYLDHCVVYYKSTWNVIRGNAALLSAHLLASSSADARQRVNVNNMCNCLTKLLGENSSAVRGKAAKALSYLYAI